MPPCLFALLPPGNVARTYGELKDLHWHRNLGTILCPFINIRVGIWRFLSILHYFLFFTANLIIN